MIDVKLLEKKGDGGSYYEEYRQSLVNRGASTDILDQIVDLNRKRKEMITAAETKKAEQKKSSEEVAKLKRSGQDASGLIEKMGQLSGQVKEMEAKAQEIDGQVYDLLLRLPNKPHSSVPVGSSAEENKLLRTVGTPVKFSFKPKEHSDIGPALDILDFERGTKVTGARFTFLKGAGAQLERALIQFMMDLHSTKHGYTEMIPPFIVNDRSMLGTGNLPKFKEDLFQLAGFNYFLIPTAEVPVTNYYNDEILEESQLPQSFCAYSPCFRSEAGSHGRDTKGLIRQHQFNKVELMTFCHPSKSYEVHDQLTKHAEQVLIDLEIPFRTMLLCTGDMGPNSAKTHDLEVWLPGQNTYREISSCSNFEDFQARRANIRFRPAGGKPQFVHTLNGSGLAVGRTLVAILENYQREDGSVAIPKALQKYMNGKTEIRK
jgi:seryl-tRNA synthetase